MLPYAPGARVVIRDEEWLVRRVDPSSDGGHHPCEMESQNRVSGKSSVDR